MPASAERSLLLRLKEDRSGNALLTAARDLDKLSHGADTAGGSFKGMASDAELLNRQIQLSSERVKDLQTQIARTGDRGLFGDLRKEKSSLAELRSIAKDIAPVGEAAAKSFTAAMSDAFSGTGPVIQTGLMVGLGGAVAAMSPMIGAVISGAVVGAVGTGGILGGVIAAAHDDRVQSAWKSFAAGVSKESFGSDAFTGPVIEAIGIIEEGFKDLDIGDALAKGADSVPVLADGLSRMANRIMPGFNAVMDQSGETTEALADGLDMFGGALGEMLTDLANSEGAVDGLRTGFALLSGTLKTGGDLIAALSDGYHNFLETLADVSGALEDIPGLDQTGWADLNDDVERLLGRGPELNKVVTGIGTAASDAKGPFEFLSGAIHSAFEGAAAYATAAYDAAIATGDLSAAWDMLNGVQMSVDEALVRAHRTIDQVAEAFREGGRAIQGNSQAAAENRLSLEQAAQAAVVSAEAYLTLTGDVAGAEKMMADFEKQAVAASGATGKQKDAVAGLADQLFRLPSDINVKINVTQINKVIGDTLTAAGTKATNLVNSMFRAEGGPVSAGRPYIVGERGPELMVPSSNGYVVPNKDLAVGRGGGGGTTVNYHLTVQAGMGVDGYQVGQQIIAAVKQYEMSNGTGWRSP